MARLDPSELVIEDDTTPEQVTRYVRIMRGQCIECGEPLPPGRCATCGPECSKASGERYVAPRTEHPRRGSHALEHENTAENKRPR
jgi:hypothetical protein